MIYIRKTIISLSEITGEAFVCPLCGRELFYGRGKGGFPFRKKALPEEDGKGSLHGGGLCRECAAGLELTVKEKECPHCGRISENNASFYCKECGSEDSCLSMRSAVVYDGFSKAIVLGLKIEKRVRFAEVMADYVYRKFNTLDWHIDVVTAVPTYTERKRYFNHSEVIARSFCAKTGLPFSSDIVKTRKIDGQETKTYEERLVNVKNVFGVVGEDFKEASVLLIDDVRTSGATLNEAARVLLEQGGAREVFGITFAGAKLRQE